MKKNRKYKIILALLIMEMLTLLSFGAGAYTYFNQTETFESDTAGSNPSETWYTFNELGLDTSDVANVGRGSSTKSLQVNDTDPDSEFCWFNMSTADNFSYAEFYFKIDNTTHNESRIYSVDSADTALARFDIISHGDTSYVTCRNYTSILWNGTITNNTWYRLRWTFNDTSNYIKGDLFNNAGTSLNSSWFPCTTASGTYNYADFDGMQIGGDNDEWIFLYIDDFKVYKQYDWGVAGVTTSYLLNTLVPLLFAIFLLIVIISMGLSGAIGL